MSIEGRGRERERERQTERRRKKHFYSFSSFSLLGGCFAPLLLWCFAHSGEECLRQYISRVLSLY